MIKVLWKYKYAFLSLILVLLLVSLNNISGLKIFYESERIIELSNESQDIIDKSLDDKNLILLASSSSFFFQNRSRSIVVRE